METRWQYSALIGPEYSALIGPQGGGGEAAGAGQRGEATQDGAQAEVQGGELQNFNSAHFKGAAIGVTFEVAGI